MKSLCNIRVSVWNPDTLKEIVRFVHEVHPVFAVTLSTFLHMLCGWKLAWHHHFIHIACAIKLRGLRQKLDALHVQNGQFHSKYQGFIRKLVCYKGISFFWNFFELLTFCVFKMHHSNPHQQFSTLSDFICSFSRIHSYFWAKWPWNWKPLQMISEKDETWHGIIISPR